MSDVDTLTLAEFLLARVAEDVEDLKTSHIYEGREWWMPLAWTRERGLAECEAKRKIVERCQRAYGMHLDTWLHEDLADDVLDQLAMPYAGHPDYRDEWKP